MKTIKQKLVTRLAALIAAATPTLAHADFYDGVRGPSTAQVHYTLSSQDTTTHTIAGKYFGENVFAIGAVTADGKSVGGGFVGIGYIAEHFKRIKAIPVVGYATSGDGKKGTLNAILQATAFLDENGTFLADSRYVVSVPMHGQENHTPAHTFGLTLSAGNERLRVGPDLNYTLKDKKVASGALIRYDLDAQHHSSWVEFGMGLEGNAQLQFRGNF